MSREDLLRNQDWARISAQLTTYAWKRTFRRSWEHAQEIAQSAIEKAWTRGEEGWDSEKEPLLKYLAKSVLSITANERARKRNKLEVAMDHEDLAALPASIGHDSFDERLDRARLAAHFKKRLDQTLADDAPATQVMLMMMEGIATPREQVRSSALSLDAIRDARRRVFYAAEKISKQLADELQESQS